MFRGTPISKRQLTAIWVGLGVIVLMGLCPPWRETVWTQYFHSKSPAGYAPIFWPPASGGRSEGIELDVERLLLQWAVVAMVTGGVVAFFGRKSRSGADVVTLERPQSHVSIEPGEPAPAKTVESLSTVISCRNGHKLRVPTDRGTLHVTCPECRDTFDWSPQGGNASRVEVRPVEQPRPKQPRVTQVNSRYSLIRVIAVAALVLFFVITCLGAMYLGGFLGRRSLPNPQENPYNQPGMVEASPSSPRRNELGDSEIGDLDVQPGFAPSPSARPLPLVALPLPENGAMIDGDFIEVPLPSASRILPTLTVVTKAGSGHHLVKVEDWNTKRKVTAFFIRSGMTTTVRIPDGTYRIKYASGDTWYGESDLFGPSTVCAVADKSFSFETEYKRGGTEYTVRTIELIEQVGGNLKTSKIRKEDF